MSNGAGSAKKKKAAEKLPRKVRKTVQHKVYHKMKKKQGKSSSVSWVTFPVSAFTRTQAITTE